MSCMSLMEDLVVFLAIGLLCTLPRAGAAWGKFAPCTVPSPRTLIVPVGEAEVVLLADTEPPCGVPAAAAAAAAAAACKSFREAFPLFFRSRAYSHFKVKSTSKIVGCQQFKSLDI